MAMDPAQASSSAPKKKANKKKKNANKGKESPAGNGNGNAKGIANLTTDHGSHEDELHDELDSPAQPDTPTVETKEPEPEPESEPAPESEPLGNGYAAEPATSNEATGHEDPTAKLEAMGKEREALRAEVEQLRIQLEGIQETHQQETSQLQTEIDESNNAKEHAEEQYQVLLGRVEKIKESLSDRLKRDKAELEEARDRIEELEAQNEQLQGSAQSSGDDMEKLKEELQDATRELMTLRSRNNLSAHNWLKEKEELTRMVHHLKGEVEQTSNAMGEWEVLAMEERSVKESMMDKVQELEEQMGALKRGYESAATERDSQSTLVDNLQNALREIQEARKKELREMVETTESQLQEQKRLAQEAEARRSRAEEANEELSKELERTAPFEKEVKEKNLLIGKLRHEAIVLNEHLTKALRYLKKTKPEDNVDRQVVTNHLLHFLTLDRGDAKRFQVLQVMAGYLNWTDEQREQAGLSRPGGSAAATIRFAASPFQRTPSSPSLHADLFSEPTTARDHRESLADLWAGFLERSAKEGGADGTLPPSRKDSMSSGATGPARPESGAR
ncbi:golgi matrix protein [Drechmeria coniospora]|uniref:Golgi matrix protein n=1 Tax=Drechmeria coniospora TaxID=98403 RepID=A0A151GMT1_DRECN|nr:golgi matrix protein [Drechmeria coniospora]KYK58413.1 golgi matrix protein [Drechmeria coniospora]ODA83779.1 hypothetical protein RJ55_02295 [Drechmeria coniospora]